MKHLRNCKSSLAFPIYLQQRLFDSNEKRHEISLAKRRDVDSRLFPPCEDTLKKHALRANYQAGVWKQSLEKEPTVPEPEGHGWTGDESNNFVID